MAEIPNLLISRPEKSGTPTLLVSGRADPRRASPRRARARSRPPRAPPPPQYVTHRKGQVDFKVSPVKKLEDGSWVYCETMEDPETTGYFKHTVDGDSQEIAFFATAPKKWCMKFATSATAGGVWACTTDAGAGEFAKTATVLDAAPAPSKFGAGGLPKGQVNLGESEEGWGNAWD